MTLYATGGGTIPAFHLPNMKGFGGILSICFTILSLVLVAAAEREHFHHDHSMKHDMVHDQTTQDKKPTLNRVNKKGACPNESGDVGICVESCSGDSDCEQDLKCCLNGCGGRQCQKPVEETQCPIRCNKMYDPVCGSDGVTYGNECRLGDIKCSRNQKFITLKEEGECQAQKNGPCETELHKYQTPMHMVGQSTPQCDEHGFYKPMQCSGSTGSCWCVTQDGKQLETTGDFFITSEDDCLKFLDEHK